MGWTVAQSKKLILLMDSCPDDVTFILRAVHKQGACEVVVAHDGAEALFFLFGTGHYERHLLPIIPDLILLDLQLSKLNGFEVLQRLRVDVRTRCIPVVILSSSVKDEDILDSYSLGANGYIRKQIDYKLFCTDMKQALDYWVDMNIFPRLARGTSNLITSR
jgi:two-component system, response regulator